MGDLYTDPQIHTERGTDFGDGNLGRLGKPAHHASLFTRASRPKSYMGPALDVEMGVWDVWPLPA